MNEILAELKSAALLGFAILKSIFEKTTVYFRCPFCNLVISQFVTKCDRCHSKIGWE